MALSAATVWELRAAGNDNNGGGFVAGGVTDYSQQDAAQLTLTDLATSGVVTTLTSVTGGFSAAMVGNLIQIASGTNFTAGFYQITAFTNGNTVTLDRAPTTAAGSVGVGSVGGALATVAKLAGAMIGSNKAYWKGSFSSNATSTFAQAITPSGSVPKTQLIGYGTTRGDSGHATLTLTTNTGLTGLNLTGTGIGVSQIDVNCGSLGTSSGIVLNASWCEARDCKVSNFSTRGFYAQSASTSLADCEATGGTTAAAIGIESLTAVPLVRCFVHDNACIGVKLGIATGMVDSLIVNNSGATSDGIQTNFSHLILNNTIHNNGRDGIHNLGSNHMSTWIRNNLITNNAGAGIALVASGSVPSDPAYDGNAFFGNTGAARANMDSVGGLYGVNPYGQTLTITNITQAASAVVTLSAPHTLQVGQVVAFLSVAGMTAINALVGSVTAVASTTITVNINSSGFGAYTSGGVIVFPFRDVTLSVSPYVGPTTGTTANFALNNTAGGGAACRAAGSPGTWPGNTGSTGYLDMGAVQGRTSNTSPSAGGSPGIIMATG